MHVLERCISSHLLEQSYNVVYYIVKEKQKTLLDQNSLQYSKSILRAKFYVDLKSWRRP